MKNFYLQMMEDDNALIRSPIMDKTKWIEKLKYDVLRFSLDSVDFNLLEVGNAISAQVDYFSSSNRSISMCFRLHPFDYVCAICIRAPAMKV